MKVTNAPATSVLARAAILFAALSALCLLLAGCASQGPGPSPAKVAAASPVVATTAAMSARGVAGGVFGRALVNPEAAVTGGRLYVAWQIDPPSTRVPRFELARAGQADGAIGAARRLPAGMPGPPLAADGWLWVTISTPASERLLRMNPVSLAVTADVTISGPSYAGLSGGHDLAAAGGGLWATSGGRLLRVSPRTGRVAFAVPLPGADTSGAGASADGKTLIISEAREGNGALQRRDPATGRLIASHPLTGVVAPLIGGVIGSGVWAAEPTGMMGYVERFGTAAMSPDPATQVEGSNGIDVRVANGLIWVSQEDGNGSRDYCAAPVTGRILGRLPLPDPVQDDVTAVSARYVYYLAFARSGAGSYLRRLPIPARCRVG
jgi:hypothetical protein